LLPTLDNRVKKSSSMPLNQAMSVTEAPAALWHKLVTVWGSNNS